MVTPGLIFEMDEDQSARRLRGSSLAPGKCPLGRRLAGPAGAPSGKIRGCRQEALLPGRAPLSPRRTSTTILGERASSAPSGSQEVSFRPQSSIQPKLAQIGSTLLCREGTSGLFEKYRVIWLYNPSIGIWVLSEQRGEQDERASFPTAPSFRALGPQGAVLCAFALMLAMLPPPCAPGWPDPAPVGSANTGRGPISVCVQGGYAYVVNTDSNTLQVFGGTGGVFCSPGGENPPPPRPPFFFFHPRHSRASRHTGKRNLASYASRAASPALWPFTAPPSRSSTSPTPPPLLSRAPQTREAILARYASRGAMPM